METLALSSTSITTTLSNSRTLTTRIKFKSIHNQPLFLTLPLKSSHSLLNLTRSRRQFVVNSTDSHHHHHDDHHHHDNHHHHHHGDGELTESQKAFVRFAKMIKWTDAADFLRENLELCCCSAVLFLAAAVSPYLVATHRVKSLQLLFTSVAFPLVAVPLFFLSVL